jgi:beta-phosphoglucomutase-like phosphatase (HAD superfamily)
MIDVLVFRLDGILINTDKLEALAYAQAAIELGGGAFSEHAVIEAYSDVAGFSRMETARYILERFNIQAAAGERMDAHNVRTPWQAFGQTRAAIYAAMLDEPLVMVKHRSPHSLDLLIWARENNFKIGAASSWNYARTQRAMQILDVANEFDFIATSDDVDRDKPDPEIYRLIAHELCIDPAAGLAIESSPAGHEAATAAGMHCLAVLPDPPVAHLQTSGLPVQTGRVGNPADLKKMVKRFLRSA